MDNSMRAALPFVVGFGLLLSLGVEAALIWFMAYCAWMIVHLILLKYRQRLPTAIRWEDHRVQILDVEGRPWRGDGHEQ